MKTRIVPLVPYHSAEACFPGSGIFLRKVPGGRVKFSLLQRIHKL